MARPAWYRTLLCTLLLAFPSGCGLGTAAVGAATSGGGGASNAATVGSDLSVSNVAVDGRAVASPATVRFLLTDQEGEAADVELLFALDRPPAPPDFLPITLAAGSPGLTQVPSGTPYSVLWDFAADLATGPGYEGDVVLRLGVLGGISPADLAGVEVGNDPPMIASATAPSAPESTGFVPVEFELADSAADSVSVRVEYNHGGVWRDARPANAAPGPTIPPAFTNLRTTLAASTETFVWDSAYDLDGEELDVVLRFTADDGFDQSVPRATLPFRVDNNDPPRVLFDNALFVNNPDETRGIPIPFFLVDEEANPVRVVVQWRRSGQAFPRLPPDVAGIEAILADPELREEMQIGTELPLPYGGLARPLASDTEICLPELAGSAAGLLAGGVAGRTLELLRSHTLPRGVAASWKPNPLRRPVAALPIGNGPTALVLDAPRGGAWRLVEIDLATGSSGREWSQLSHGKASIGDPSAMAYEPGEAAVLVASAVGRVWQVHRADLASGRATRLISGLDGSTEHGRARGIVSLGTDVALITVGSSLIRLDFGPSVPPRATTLLDGLATPWGIVADPLQANRVYVAERDGIGTGGGVGRVISVELDTYVIAEVFTDPLTPPGEGLERPRAIALERGGARLLAVTDANPGDDSRELRGVDIGGKETGVVFELAQGMPEDTRGLAVGPDELRMLALPSANDLAVGGGVLQRRTVAGYDPTNLTVTVTEPFEPAPAPNTPWRITDELGLAESSDTPKANVFVWDSADAVEGEVALRIVPLDTDVGFGVEGIAEKRIRSFQEPVAVGSVSDQVQSIVAADLDDDGWLDLVTAMFTRPNGPDGLTIFYQEAPGVFSATPDVTLGGANTATRAPHQVVAADLNGDGRLDLASSNENTHDLSIFFQPSSGGFVNEFLPDRRLGQGLGPVFAGGTGLINKPIGLEAADLNGDGLLDLAMTNTISGTVTVFFQTSPGMFDPDPTVLEGGRIALRAPQIESADLNGDGRLDLACATHDGPFPGGVGYLSVFLQTGPRQFVRIPAPPPSTGVASRDVLVADLDGDGQIDLASANWSSNGFGGTAPGDHTITLHLQERGAPGRFPEDPELVMQEAGSIDFPVSLVGSDLNADGRLDLISANQETDNLTVFLRDSKGSFPTTPDFALGGTAVMEQPQHHEVVDLNGDGLLDMVSASLSSGRAVFLHSAPGEFGLLDPLGSGARLPDDVLGTSASTDGVEALVAADLDGDGLTDVASANRLNDNLTVFFQDAVGRFPATPDVVRGDSTSTDGPSAIAAADLNGDGLLDLASANELGNNLTLFFQTAPGQFSIDPVELGSSATTNAPRSIVAADLNGDGRLDLAAACRDSNRVAVFFQLQGPQTGFVKALPDVRLGSFATTRRPISVVAADLNGDGFTDLVSGNIGKDSIVGTITVFLQPLSGGFVAPSTPGVVLGGRGFTTEPGSVVAADLNGDGLLDLAAADRARNRLPIFFQPKGGFVTRTSPNLVLRPGAYPRSLVAADLNRDGLLDLASANQTADDLTVFFQSSPGRFATAPDLVLGGMRITDSPVSIVAGDLNSDGELDLAAAIHRDSTSFGNRFDAITIFFGGK